MLTSSNITLRYHLNIWRILNVMTFNMESSSRVKQNLWYFHAGEERVKIFNHPVSWCDQCYFLSKTFNVVMVFSFSFGLYNNSRASTTKYVHDEICSYSFNCFQLLYIIKDSFQNMVLANRSMYIWCSIFFTKYIHLKMPNKMHGNLIHINKKTSTF